MPNEIKPDFNPDKLKFRRDAMISVRDLNDLFSSFGEIAQNPWSWELANLEKVMYALRRSSHAVYAYYDQKLIGIARSMDDAIWSANIDCVVVHKAFQRLGIGREMMKRLIQDLGSCAFISVSSNDKHNIDFYRSLGFDVLENGVLLQILNDNPKKQYD